MRAIGSRGQLALEGGEPAVRQAVPPMYPGGLRIGREEEEAVLQVLRSKRLFRYYGPGTGTSKVQELEKAFAEYMGVGHSLAVASGTLALTAALAALEVGPGDEVIVPAYTWISTPAAVAAVGAVPVIAEVDSSLTLDPAAVESRLTPRTRAIVAVHMRGAPCHMDALMSVSERSGVAVLEDVAQACGGSFRGRRLGSIGQMGAFSLQYTKAITCGDGGMVTTSDRRCYDRAQMYHDVVASQRADLPPEELVLGIGCRMPELLGAVAGVQLTRLDGLLADLRIRNAAVRAGIADVAQSKGLELRAANDLDGDIGIALVCFLPTAERAGYVAKALHAEGVPSGLLFSRDQPDYHIYYHWTPILAKQTWSRLGPWSWPGADVRYDREMCPRTLDLLGRAVQVHVSPDLSAQNVEEIVEGLNKVLSAAL
ncbi:MAG: aminotransferase class I/II-fold pyridoxal phosphate-dependent enzyme [Chloroflexota bacterium]|nr:aminotransferase class I/II-fold pyridoxal phosphate-dependent enzyme [Chloroflexota bacterium]